MGKHFNTRIREARELVRLSQAELASKFGVTGPTISNWENRISAPSSEQQAKVIQWIEEVELGSGAPQPQRDDISTAADPGQDNDDVALRCLKLIYDQWPQSRIAEALSVSQGTVSNWLRNGNVNLKYSGALQRLWTELKGESGGKSNGAPQDGKVRGEETQYADWLRTELERLGTNAVELASRTGIHVNTILALLEGRTEKPQQRTREKIEKALRASHPTGAEQPVEVPVEEDTWYYIGLPWKADEIDQVPDEPGVYVINDRLGRPAYIGVAHKGAGGIRGRLKKHNELRWTSDQRVACSFSYALAGRMPRTDPSQLAKSLEKLLIKFMGNAILINEKDVVDIAD